MPNYHRLFLPGCTYFFTVNLFDRRRSLLVDRIDLLRQAIRITRQESLFHIRAAVILPDHLHMIWQLPSGDADYPARWRKIKTRFSRGLPSGEERSESRRRRGERGIWQRRYWEHAIRDSSDFEHHVDYIHFNPVKHGLVRHPLLWPYSTIHRFARQGWRPRDGRGGEPAFEDHGFGE